MHLGQNCLGLGGVARLSGEGLRTLPSLAENTDLTESFLQAIWAVLLKVVTAVMTAFQNGRSLSALLF